MPLSEEGRAEQHSLALGSTDPISSLSLSLLDEWQFRLGVGPKGVPRQRLDCRHRFQFLAWTSSDQRKVGSGSGVVNNRRASVTVRGFWLWNLFEILFVS